MQRKPLGRTGLAVSGLCLGTMSFGAEADEAEAGRIYAAARDAGVDFFDCANTYADGRSEEILGRLIAPHRHQITLTSKVGSDGSCAPRAIRRELEGSLRRLGTDWLDVYFLHRFDPATPIEDSLRTLEDLRAEGRILHVGLSNWAAWQIATALGIAALRGWARPAALQPMYSLVKRQAEVEILPLALAEGLAVIPYSPLGGGLLTGKYAAAQAGAGAAGGRLKVNPAYARRYDADWMRDAAAGLRTLADEAGVHPATLAVAWAASHPGVTAPIVGARSVAQLRPSLAAAEVALPEDFKAKLDALSRSPAPATDRLEEQG